MATAKWQIYIDRGGTFTDLIAISDKEELKTAKLLSHSPHYSDAAIEGIRRICPNPAGIAEVRMGTTVGTNALLERKGAKTLLVTCTGFGDVLKIAYQNRPETFALNIVTPQPLYSEVVEIKARTLASGVVLYDLDEAECEKELATRQSQGFDSLAIVFPHADRFPDQEQQIKKLARKAGFQNISCSHEVSPTIRFVRRGNTTVLDAYLNPILKDYVRKIKDSLKNSPLHFMQSHGGLCSHESFRGHNCLLSGPAGGLIGAVKMAQQQGIEKIIAFDMGGTSTDVAHFNGGSAIRDENEFGGQYFHLPMLDIHTVAAGGGSILHHERERLRVGPDSAGAMPGPASYRQNGPLTLTDCNLHLNRILPEYFPKVFGPNRNQPLDREVVAQKLTELADQNSQKLAQDFLRVGVENMANAIRRISVQRGYKVSDYTLVCFGGAGAQLSCAIADNLNMKKVFVPPLASLLSAYGIGVADEKLRREKSMQLPFNPQLDLKKHFAGLESEPQSGFNVHRFLKLKHEGSDTSWEIPWTDYAQTVGEFKATHQQETGFDSNRPIVIESLIVEYLRPSELPQLPLLDRYSEDKESTSVGEVTLYPVIGKAQKASVYEGNRITPGKKITGPSVICEEHTTLVVDPGWLAQRMETGGWLLDRELSSKNQQPHLDSTGPEPAMLEVFYNRFMNIAEQMGERLKKTAHSVNIKERLDFSCALFDRQGHLVANAPHMPVHLGSMEESLHSVIQQNPELQDGDEYLLNSPYSGGTHLPDITLVRPVFIQNELKFFTASRGHHADVGGISPGSMPAASTRIEEEGVLIKNFKFLHQGRINEEQLLQLLEQGEFPCRQPQVNLNDLKAQSAANYFGQSLLIDLCREFGTNRVTDYVNHIQNYAEQCTREKLQELDNGEFQSSMDDSSQIKVKVVIDKDQGKTLIDFTGTSSQQASNFNAPIGVSKAAVAYVFRCLLDKNIPLNHGGMIPLEMRIPDGCLLSPHEPAAVVAGNVETSQVITDTLFAALGKLAASQGSMNNLSFGTEEYQYYETIAGGCGAGEGFDGASGVQSHMTNSRLTDPEILETRFPVVLHEFSIRQDSGGKGKFNGGNGCKRRIEFLQPMQLSILANRRKVPPHGIKGGANGQPGKNTLVKASGKKVDLGSCTSRKVMPKDQLIIETPGGGGFGEE